eukprot:g10008.t1
MGQARTLSVTPWQVINMCGRPSGESVAGGACAQLAARSLGVELCCVLWAYTAGPLLLHLPPLARAGLAATWWLGCVPLLWYGSLLTLAGNMACSVASFSLRRPSSQHTVQEQSKQKARLQTWNAHGIPTPKGACFMTHGAWREALFVHWPVKPELLQQALPQGLEVDTYQGDAYIGLVLLRECEILPALLSRCLPNSLATLLAVSHNAVNVRTYVKPSSVAAASAKLPSQQTGAGGVYFFSLDADSLAAVTMARGLFNLPYHLASMRRDCTQTEHTLPQLAPYAMAMPVDTPGSPDGTMSPGASTISFASLASPSALHTPVSARTQPQQTRVVLACRRWKGGACLETKFEYEQPSSTAHRSRSPDYNNNNNNNKRARGTLRLAGAALGESGSGALSWLLRAPGNAVSGLLYLLRALVLPLLLLPSLCLLVPALPVLLLAVLLAWSLSTGKSVELSAYVQLDAWKELFQPARKEAAPMPRTIETARKQEQLQQKSRWEEKDKDEQGNNNSENDAKLANWLTERYCLYQKLPGLGSGQVHRGTIYHKPWKLVRSVRLLSLDQRPQPNRASLQLPTKPNSRPDTSKSIASQLPPH